jgi:putative spermidine/putrescine transport system substrate-binding protein
MQQKPTRSRRQFLVGAALISATALALTGCSNDAQSGGSGSGSIVIASYGGSFQDAQTKAYFNPFGTDSGISVTGTQGSSYDKVKAMVNSGQMDWDVVSAESSAYVNEAADGLLEPIDYSTVKADGVPDSLKQEFGIGYLTFGQNVAWSKKAFPNGMTAAQFFDPAVKARRALPAEPSYTLEFALLGDGVKPADLYPLDVDRAFKALSRIKDQVVAFKGSADIQSLMQQNEIDAAFIPNGRVEDATSAGADWAYSWDGAVADTEWWVVPKGAPNKAGAMKFVDYATSAKPQAAMSEAILYGPTNTKAFEFISKDRVDRLPGNPSTTANSAILDPKWWAENRETVKAQWDQWLLTK